MLAVAAAACGSDNAHGHASAMRHFRSQTYGYSIDYPATWTTIAADEKLADNQPPVTGAPVTDILAQRASRRIRQMQEPAFGVGAQRVPRSTTVAEWTPRVIALVSTFKGCPGPATTENIRVGGAPAVLLTYPDCPKGSGLYHLWTAFVHNGLGYQMVWFNHPGQEAADRAVLQRMLASVRFD